MIKNKKQFCYAVNKRADQDNRGLKLVKAKLISFVNYDVKELRKMAKFILICANEIKSYKHDSYHRHYSLYDRSWNSSKIDIQIDVR